VLEKSSQAHLQMTLVHFRSLRFKAPDITLYVPVLQFPQAMHSLSRTVLASGTGRRSFTRAGFFNFNLKLNFKLERTQACAHWQGSDSTTSSSTSNNSRIGTANTT